MNTYLVVFSINLSDALKDRYDATVEAIGRLNCETVQFNKTCFLVKWHSGKRDTLRDIITEEIKKNGSDGRVLVVEVLGSAWSCYWDTSDKSLGKRLRNIISKDV